MLSCVVVMHVVMCLLLSIVALQENAEAEARMREEDIDTILERAEVVDSRALAGECAGGDLLNSFNVATFKNEEDDVAFWNRLIPAAERPVHEDIIQDDLLPRWDGVGQVHASRTFINTMLWVAGSGVLLWVA